MSPHVNFGFLVFFIQLMKHIDVQLLLDTPFCLNFKQVKSIK